MNHNFNVIANDNVAGDIQEAVNYYNQKKDLLGTRFYNSAKTEMNSLKKDALLFQIRYENVRCLKVKNFPYLIHYTVNKKTKTVRIYSVTGTHKAPFDSLIR